MLQELEQSTFHANRTEAWRFLIHFCHHCTQLQIVFLNSPEFKSCWTQEESAAAVAKINEPSSHLCIDLVYACRAQFLTIISTSSWYGGKGLCEQHSKQVNCKQPPFLLAYNYGENPVINQVQTTVSTSDCNTK